MVTRLIVGAISRPNCPGPNFGASPPLLRFNSCNDPVRSKSPFLFCCECVNVSFFFIKIKACKKYLDRPDLVDGELEPGATFWCHFCEDKVAKHVTDRSISIRYGGLFEHISRYFLTINDYRYIPVTLLHCD